MSAPEETTVDVCVVGTGFSGLGMAIRLEREGKRSYVVLEKAESVGGTWRENTYPGCACDIPSSLYSFSFAPKPNWSRMYPAQPEIQAYLEDVATRFGVRPQIRFGQEARAFTWDERSSTWLVETVQGLKVRAGAVVSGMGGLHKPAYPDLPGRDRFQGPAFHSARWDHGVELAGKRVAVIGTGASAIQFVPQIQPHVARLDLYQRTPAWIMPKGDRAMAEWEQSAFAAAPVVQELYRRAIWGLNEIRGLAFLKPERIGAGEDLARKHLESQVQDPALRAKLTPSYRMGCKRVLISNDFYPAVAQPNVCLITDRIAEITETGVRAADGTHREVDVLIYATGFKPMDVLNPARVVGRAGRVLNEEWGAHPEAYWGLTVSGFPNFFLLMGPNTGLGHNSMVFMIESQIHYVMEALALMEQRGKRALDVRPEAQAAFVADIDKKLGQTVWSTGCMSWYLADDGKNRTIWPGFTFEYRAGTRRVAEGDYVWT